MILNIGVHYAHNLRRFMRKIQNNHILKEFFIIKSVRKQKKFD